MQRLDKSYKQTDYLEFLNNTFGFSQTLKPITIDNQEVKSFEQLGFITTSDAKKLPVFEIHIKPNTKLQRNRVQLRNLVAKKIQLEDGALAVYVDGENKQWRFSFIAIEYKFTEDGVKKEQTASKRFTYLLGEGMQTRTAKLRFETLNKTSTLADLETAFAVETLNEDFFKELYKWYEKAQQEVIFPNDENAQSHTQAGLIRFLTRILFVWFLKEKHLINPDLFNVEKLKALIDYDKNSSFYKAILQNLFFATLNRQISNDNKTNRSFRKRTPEGKVSDADYLVTSIYRYQDYFRDQDEQKIMGLFKQTPFLNGGLFECLDREASDEEKSAYSQDKTIRKVCSAIRIDGFSDGKKNPLDFNNALFFNASETGLCDLFKRYQFTVEESTPLDIEVALDPELLGKVFENLLATYNPETGEQARKATGSFYTPREIVSYMVDESLKQHFKTATGLDDETINELFIESENKLKCEQIQAVIKAIDNLKILDPAVGSGAYPMGVLQRLVFILEKIDHENKHFKQQQLGKAEQMDEASKKVSIEVIEQVFSAENQHNAYGKKLMLIEKCIYGVDIQAIAIQICKLRFFISLAIEHKPNSDPYNNYGIKALPNLETKFIVANSLLPLDEKPEHPGLFDTDIDNLKTTLAQVRHQYFTAKTLSTKRKYRDQDREIRQTMLQTLKKTGITPAIETSMTKVVNWDLYNQNAQSDWFDPEWQFGVKVGFDVVLGNPPYAQIKRNIYPKANFPYAEGKDKGKQNLYKLFLELSYNLCNKNGVATMIVQSSLMGDLSAAATRQLLLDKTHLQHIIEFPKTAKAKDKQVFSSVTQGTCIYQFLKQKSDNYPINISIDNDSHTIKQLQFSEITKQDIKTLYPTLLYLPKIIYGSTSILNRIAKNSNIEPLVNFAQSIRQGDINLTSQKAQFSQQVSDTKLLRGRHTQRYHVKYNEADEYILTGCQTEQITFNQVNIFLVSQEITGMVDERRLHFALHQTQQPIIWGHTVNKILLTDQQHSQYFLALLNSKFMDWYFRITSSNNHVQGYELKQLPIPKIAKPEQQPFIELVDKILTAKKDGKDTTALEAQIDKMVYRLYNLSPAEIKIIEAEK
ncbi:MAG: hypothetical protein A6F72_08210 [Cycloclasticus sp. symbiont of Poecilosclerida sp. N]|nr:MAG: hypothetical protein A6F72_08210 [Cycloclasticus sp. symbiont of Poecilosclerida sp. N]